MAKHLAPALARGEWLRRTLTGHSHPDATVEILDAMYADAERLVVSSASSVPLIAFAPEKAMALANSALPPDSPYKITREDAAAIAVLLHAGDFARITSPADHPQNQALNRVHQLREKIIAIVAPQE